MTDAYIINTYLGALIILDVLLGLVPAAIAGIKGHNFLLWWIYGTLLLLIALIHSICTGIKEPKPPSAACRKSLADEIGKLKKLLDEGAISQAEYDERKFNLISGNM